MSGLFSPTAGRRNRLYVMFAVVVVTLVGSFLLSLVGTFLIRRVAIAKGFVDSPGGHKRHEAPVALGGGIAITCAVCLPVLFAVAAARAAVRYGVPEWLPEFLQAHAGGVAQKAPEACAIVGGAVVLHLMGLLDDVRPLGPGIKFAVQTCVGFALASVFGIRLLELEMLPVWVSVVLTTLWIVLITNAFNFLDNMDGLCAGVAAIAGIMFALAAFGGGQIFVPAMMLLVVGALLGFLVFNFPPASIFMGDSGSMVVGYFMAVLIVLTTFYNPSQKLMPAGVLLPLVVLAVPLYDVASVIVHRLRAGVSIFRGDHRHFSHRLTQRGMTSRTAVLTIYLATAATSLSAILLPSADWPTALLIFGQCLCVVLIIAILEHMRPTV